MHLNPGRIKKQCVRADERSIIVTGRTVKALKAGM
jgi:hypothetical protein